MPIYAHSGLDRRKARSLRGANHAGFAGLGAMVIARTHLRAINPHCRPAGTGPSDRAADAVLERAAGLAAANPLAAYGHPAAARSPPY